jgi:predicted AAA+ superfamily ATPase
VLERQRRLAEVLGLLDTVPCVAILGARQVGKTTLSRVVADRWNGPVHAFDLERAADLARLAEPELALEPLEGLIVLDEVQRAPELFPALRVFIDRHPDRRVLALGSAAPDMLRQSSETLAGRIAFCNLPPFTVDETGAETIDALWLRGGFPRAFLAPDDSASFRWRLDFVRTFIERDLPSLGSQVPPTTTDRFWRMLTHAHGQVWNSARFASSFGVADTTVRRYLDLLTSALVVRQLRPWHENVGKRQVRSPKVYVADSGLLHALLDLPDRTALERHPVLGASWEGFVLQQIAAATSARDDQQYFWATHAGAELDVLLVRGGTKVGFEIKRTVAPQTTRSMRSAQATLGLDRLYVIHAGPETFPLGNGIEAVAAGDLATRTEF